MWRLPVAEYEMEPEEVSRGDGGMPDGAIEQLEDMLSVPSTTRSSLMDD